MIASAGVDAFWIYGNDLSVSELAFWVLIALIVVIPLIGWITEGPKRLPSRPSLKRLPTKETPNG